MFDATLAPGTEFAGYVIDDVLARGGMGVVYRATQHQPKRRVALKLISPERAADPAYRERFLREMDMLASLEHPNIVPIHAAGEWQGQLYLAMRLVDGPDLGVLIAAEAPMPLARAVQLLAPIADALGAAHAEGLVHRDVKPANILVDGRGATYLTDFGLTKRTASESGLTMPGQAVGSPGYMSPEQFTTGLSHDAGVAARADQYSFACVLFTCLTGHEPYERDRWEAAMWAHVHEPVPRLSAARPDLPVELDAIVERAMAKQPDARYPSVGAFMAAVRAVVPRSSDVARPVPDAPAERRRLSEAATPSPPLPLVAAPAQPSTPPLQPSTPPPAPDGMARAVPAPPPPASPVPGAGADPGGSGPARRPTGLVFAAVAVAVVAVVAVGVIVVTGRPGGSVDPTGTVTVPTATPASPRTATPSASRSASPDPGSSVGTAGETPPPAKAAGYARLLAMIPEPVRSTCGWIDYETAEAGASCIAGGASAFYTLYADVASTRAGYNGARDYFNIPAGKGDCATDDTGDSPWADGTLVDRGRVFCQVKHPVVEAIVGWSQEQRFVEVELWGTDVRAMYDLWRSGAVWAN